MRHLVTCLVILLFPSFCLANGKQAPDVVLSFHLESSPSLGSKMVFPWQTAIGKKHFRITSEFKTDEIIGQRPFPSPHAETEYGMIIQFDKDAQRRLYQMTLRNKGKYLIVFMNGKPVDMLRIDKGVSDGIICVWRGFLPSDVHKADKLVPRIGENRKKWKARLKADAKK